MVTSAVTVGEAIASNVPRAMRLDQCVLNQEKPTKSKGSAQVHHHSRLYRSERTTR